MNTFKRYLPLIVVLIFVTVLALAPAAQVFFQTKGAWRGIIPEYPNDAMFYFARMAQVSHGYPFLGNPYIWEYRMAPALSFFVADWLAAVPLLLGASFALAVILNPVFWSVLFALVGYLLFKKLEMTDWQSAVATMLSYSQVYWLTLRPVVMQIIFPVYLLFLLAYLLWFKVPASKKRIIFLAVVSALTFYIYTFLWQIVGATFAFTYLYFIIKKRWNTIRALMVSNAITAVLAAPMLVYMIKQTTSQFYWETMVRVNLIYSRIPTVEAYYYGRWVVLAFLLCFIFKWHKSDPPEAEKERTLFGIVGITGLALLVASVSNVFLNKEVDTADHIGRFIVLWFSIIFCTVLVYSWRKIGKDGRVSKSIKIGIVAVLLIVSLGYAKNFFRARSIFNVDQSNVISIQDYATPLNWLDKNTTPGQVVWVLNPKIGLYVSILTHNFSLFHPSAVDYLMPSSELEERYLVYHYFDDPSATDLKRLSYLYAGAGVQNQPKAHNRWVQFCNFFHLDKLGYKCGDSETVYSYYEDNHYFSGLRDIYIRQIVPNINSELAKFHVSYLVIDKQNDQLKRPLKNIKGLVLAYKDTRFEIYKLNQK